MLKIKSLILSVLLVLLCGCSSEKFLGEDGRLLTSVSMVSDNPNVETSSYGLYIQQKPNTKWFGLFKVPLALYCLSGTDSTSRANRFWQRIGEAPVVYDQQITYNSQTTLAIGLKDKGYLNPSVSVQEMPTRSKKKVKLLYTLHPGQPYTISHISFEADDARIDSLINISRSESQLKQGMLCDAQILDKERTRLTNMLHNHGYYKVLKKFIRYEIDTLRGPSMVDLKLIYAGRSVAQDTTNIYSRYHINDVNFIVRNQSDTQDSVIVKRDSFNISYQNTSHHTFRPLLLTHNSHIKPHQPYKEENTTATYRSLSRLGAIRYASIQMQEVDSALLDCNIYIQPNRTNTLGIEIEGTNTAGNLGVASNLSYTNRNLFRGSESWTTKLKGAYEAITGLEGYSDQNYVEIGVETRLTFPRLIIPSFISNHQRGTSNLSFQFDTQERPEFHRRVLTLLWNYQWANRSGSTRQRLDLPSLNYVYMPWISNTFRQEYLQSDNYHSALIRYAYENLLIFNFTYTHSYNSASSSKLANKALKQNPYQLNWSVESAGNLLYALSHPLHLNRNEQDQYTLFDVAYAQYLKFDVDYSKHIVLDSRNSLAAHACLGLAQPYGNSRIVPFEKRYFGGGANGIRGWGVRELGPGRYTGQDGKVDFINQTGNLKLLISAELRSNLFWKLSGAAFLDAGNIWNTRYYEATGHDGMFHFYDFWKQIAASYGLGLRMNLDYFILRFDMAMKAINPTFNPSEKEYLPLLRPRFSRDFTFHFAVGLPF